MISRSASVSLRKIPVQLTRRVHSATAERVVDGRPIKSILIANRGEIAIRVARTASQHGVRTTTLYTDPDARSQHAQVSPFAVNLGEPTAYLNGKAIIDVAKQQKCDSIHPGYGFLSENSEFARDCVDAGLVFIGPPWKAIEAMGNKSRSKEIMIDAGVPCIPGYHGENQDPAFLKQQADQMGYPVLLKAVKGGGGKGMRICRSGDDFFDQLASAKSESRNSFGDDTMLVEKYITTPRHIEVQIFADKHGNCVALGERDCSIQRRHQKIIEESPAPNLPDTTRKELWEKARAAALAVGYEGAGTVEFIFDNESGEFFFMEMNTRLQVEHPVTEMVTGQDLVQWQILVAEGQPLPLTQELVEKGIQQLGWAFEARIYAENPEMDFMPDSGEMLHLRTPETAETVRIDAGFVQGDEISSFYDPMIAKLIVRGPTRAAALQKLRAALEKYEIAGPVTNIEFLKRLCDSSDFAEGSVETGYINKHRDELFGRQKVPREVWAQAALGLWLQDSQRSESNTFPPAGSSIGFARGYNVRKFRFTEVEPQAGEDSVITDIDVRQTSPNTFDVIVNGTTYSPVTANLKSGITVEAFFPHARLSANVVAVGDKVSVFQQGRHYRLRQTTCEWIEKALGIKDVANSVLAPMPCKILRVEVSEGDEVKKDQPLIVIESMKMETVLRSDQNGKISKILHRQGDVCKAGTALVEFEAPVTS